jgi:hypothetical protein
LAVAASREITVSFIASYDVLAVLGLSRCSEFEVCLNTQWMFPMHATKGARMLERIQVGALHCGRLQRTGRSIREILGALLIGL